MFSELSIELVQFFSGNSDFTQMMNHDGRLQLYPIVASEKATLPLTTYVLGTKTPETKDRSQIEITANFWFSKNSYDACCEFTDKMCNLIENSNYNFISSEINFDEQTLTYYGQIIFNLF